MPLYLPCLTCVLSLPVGSSVRPLSTRLPPGALVRGPSARTGPTVWTRAAGLCASASRASVAPSVRSCSVSTSWTGTLTCSSLTYRTGQGPTSRCRCVPRALGREWSQTRGTLVSGQNIKMHPCPGQWGGPYVVQNSLDVHVSISA